MNPLTELINTFSKKPTTSGVVVAVTGLSVIVSTFRGPQTYILATNTPIKVGDKVSIAGGQVVARLAPDDTIPNYVV